MWKMTNTCLSLLTGMLLVLNLHAQRDRGAISGFVKDPSGAAIVGASVSIQDETTAATARMKTNESGYYQAPNLVSAFYKVEVDAPGFKKFSETHVKLDAASTATVDVVLAVGAVTESVEVVASSAQVQADTAQVGRVVESKQITDLTLNGRNPLYLPLLLAGVNGPSIASFDPDGLGNGGFTVNGGRADENAITVDGAQALRTRAAGAILGTLNVDTVQEVQVLTANYAAEYGRASGGQLRYITKSGGQAFHGALWEYFKNNVLNANTWARNASGVASQAGPTPYRFNEFGYAVGGPVYIPKKFNTARSKLFFFSSIQFIRWHQYSTSSGTVPSLAMRQGDFSETLSATNKYFSTARTITDPLNNALFPGNIIPKSRLSPNGVGLMSAYPVPTPNFISTGATNWFVSNPDPRHTSQDTFKIDYHINDNNILTVRGTVFEYHEIAPFRGTFDLIQLQTNRPNYTSVASLTTTLTPTLMNEAVFAASADRDWNDPSNNGRYQREQYGINFPFLFPGTKDIPSKIPTITVTNFSTVDGGPYPAYSGGPIYTWSDTVTKIHGNHTLKFGISIERSGQNDRDEVVVSATPGSTNNQNGGFTFADTGSALTTGMAMANAALGLFNSYAEVGKKDFTVYRATGTDLFAQDGWKVSQKLKLDFGVRYMYWPPWHAMWGNIASFNPAYYDPKAAVVIDPKTGAVVSGLPYNGMVLPGDSFPQSAVGRVPAASDPSLSRLFHGLPGGLAQTHSDVIDPRLGIAYSFDSKTVLRGGVGSFHNRLVINDNTLLGGNAPLQLMQVVTNGSADNPGGSGGVSYPLLVSMQDPVNKIPIAWNWNLTMQRQIPFSSTIEVGYVGRAAYFLPRDRNLNSLTQGTVQANPGVSPDALRTYKGYGQIVFCENAAQANYHGLQVTLNHRFHSGLGFGAAYTFSKTIDNSDGKSEYLFNAFDPRGYRGPATTDRTQVLVINYIYDIPFLLHNKGLLGKTLGGWELSGISQFQSGQPGSIFGSVDQAGVGTGNGSQPFNVSGNTGGTNKAFSLNNTDQNFWFNPAAFSLPAAGTFGNAGKGILRGPDSQIWNLAMRKNFRVTERMRFQLRGEAYNFLNHPNWSNPSTSPTSAAFAKIQSKSGNREIQVAARLEF